MRDPFRIFIGYDHRQPVSFTVLVHSIAKHAKRPVQIMPLILPAMPIRRSGLTPFTFSRFCVPYLSGYEGWSLFLDADMMARADVTDIFDHIQDDRQVVACDTDPAFERAAVMLFNNAECRMLTPEFIEKGENLHRLGWADRVGYMGNEWNYLVGYDEPDDNAKLVHFTQGVPAFPETRDVHFADEWRDNLKEAVSSVPWFDLMGTSVHARPVMERLHAARA